VATLKREKERSERSQKRKAGIDRAHQDGSPDSAVVRMGGRRHVVSVVLLQSGVVVGFEFREQSELNVCSPSRRGKMFPRVHQNVFPKCSNVGLCRMRKMVSLIGSATVALACAVAARSGGCVAAEAPITPRRSGPMTQLIIYCCFLHFEFYCTYTCVQG
jgi:hypothetical protein